MPTAIPSSIRKNTILSKIDKIYTTTPASGIVLMLHNLNKKYHHLVIMHEIVLILHTQELWEFVWQAEIF